MAWSSGSRRLGRGFLLGLGHGHLVWWWRQSRFGEFDPCLFGHHGVCRGVPVVYNLMESIWNQ